MKLLVLFYSTYGHVYRMAEAEAEGARQVEGVVVEVMRVPETIPVENLERMGAYEAQKAFAHIPVLEPKDLKQLVGYDAIIFGTPTRYGMMAGQMRNVLDQLGSLWVKHAFVGKVGGVFTSSGTQHGGQESTILNFHTTLLHLGMIITGLPYKFEGQSIGDEITGCSPYGASTIAGSDGSRWPSENELAGARYQGRLVAEITKKLVG